MILVDMFVFRSPANGMSQSSIVHRRIAFLGFPHQEGFVRGFRYGFTEVHTRLLGKNADPFLLSEQEDELEPNNPPNRKEAGHARMRAQNKL
ncbi:MAG: hypothetical protein P4L46_01240 [Fimbriimonas sp.]|nr:hypothetical protein [Fimbriimonas sp.]